MKTTPKEIQRLIANSDMSGGETLDIYYRNGRCVEGFVMYVNMDYDPPVVTLTKRASKA